MNNKIKILFILFFLTVQNVSAIEIEVSSVHPQSYFIQVGAFKKVSNIQKVKDKLFEYDIYLEAYKNMKRIYVVNILASSLNETLIEIRKIYPNAFVAKHPKVNSDKIVNDISIEIPYGSALDSNTILKTRKSFL